MNPRKTGAEKRADRLAQRTAITPLIYPTPVNLTCTNILLIDERVADVSAFTTATNTNTFPITYAKSSTKSDMDLVLDQFTTIDRLAIVFSGSQAFAKPFLDKQPLFTEGPDAFTTGNLAWFIATIKKHSIKHIDFLACDTLSYQSYKDFYQTLSTETGVIVGASSDRTGNIKYGGDWVMESTSENVELIYFTQSIGYYQFLLDTMPTWADLTTGYPDGMAVAGNYMYVALNDNDFIAKVNLHDPTIFDLSWSETGSGPIGLTIHDGYIYVANYNSTYVGKISLDNPSIDFNHNWADMDGGSPFDVKIAGNYLYVSIPVAGTINKVSLIDPVNDITYNWASPGEYPMGIDIKDNYLYSANNNSYTIGRVSLIDPDNDTNVNWFATDNVDPTAIAIYGGYLYFTDDYSGYYVKRISLANRYTDNNLSWAQTSDYSEALIIHPPFLYASIIDYYLIERTAVPLAPIAGICFPANTPMCIDQGTVNISQIDPKNHTLGGQPIRAITQTHLLDKDLVCFERDALNHGIPRKRTIMSRDHCIFYRGKMTPAHIFIGKHEGVTTVPYNGETMYNILLDRHQTVNVNGLTCETLDPENVIAKLYMGNYNPNTTAIITDRLNKFAVEKRTTERKNRRQRIFRYVIRSPNVIGILVLSNWREVHKSL
jgi:hypothetical protein